jgi:hypothetical protein
VPLKYSKAYNISSIKTDVSNNLRNQPGWVFLGGKNVGSNVE